MVANVTAGFDDHFSGDTPFDLNIENEIEMHQGCGFDQKLVVVVSKEVMKMFNGEGGESNASRDYASTSHAASRQWNHELTKNLVSHGVLSIKAVTTLSCVKAQGEIFTAVLVYVDDMLLTDTGMHLNQRKYILDLLTDAGLTGAKPLPFPLPTQLKLSLDKGTSLKDAGVYRRLTKIQKLLKTAFFPTHLQLADVMTKALGELQHTFLVDKLGLTEAPT
ncbi:retrovirus-related pol polyprotein from transposon TNT 1-94 [Tanacetum coccineum]